MKEVSIEFREEFCTVIDKEMTDDDFEAYCNGQKTLHDIFGDDIYEDVFCDFDKYGSNGITENVISVEDI